MITVNVTIRERSLFTGRGGPVNLGGGLQFSGLPFGEGYLFLGPLPGRLTIFWASDLVKKNFELYKAVKTDNKLYRKKKLKICI